MKALMSSIHTSKEFIQDDILTRLFLYPLSPHRSVPGQILAPLTNPDPGCPCSQGSHLPTLPAGEDGAGSPGAQTCDVSNGVESQSTDDGHLG